MPAAIGFVCQDASSPLVRTPFERRALRPEDVQIEILYCGVCHSDLHTARNDWGRTVYPCCPGHEIVGRVTALGAAARKFAVGDHVAVGCLVDSCLECDQCRKGEEQLCRRGSTGTYNGKDRITGENTFGGYSSAIVVREEFLVRVPKSMDLARVAPLLCAGITTWSPLRRYNVGPGVRVGVAGLGGLGHMAVKLAVGLGTDVTVLSRSESKRDDALALGAKRALLTTDKAAMRAATASFDVIIDTIPVAHDVSPYLHLLDIDGALVVVGAIDMMPTFHSGLLLGGRRKLTGSPIGGIRETQELIDFCAEKNILPDCETIAMQDINHAYERLEKADVKYRFVIDMGSLKAA